MKIESKDLGYRNKTINFCDGIVVKFDGLGCAEVDDKEAKTLFEVYGDFVCEKGKTPKKDKIKEESTDSESKEIIEKLEQASSVKDEKIKELESKLITETESSNSWKELYEKASKEVDKNELSDKIKVLESENKLLVIKCELLTKTRAELIETAKGLEIPEEDYQKLKVPEIVELLLTKL